MMQALAGIFLAAALVLLFAPSAPRALPRQSKAGPGRDQPVGLVLELSASLLESGLPVGAVLEVLGSVMPPCAPLRTVARCLEMNMDWEQAWQECPAWLEPVQRALRFSQGSGARSAFLLRNAAALHRRERVKTAQEIGAQFGTKLVLPLGLCALPAFIALGVVPIIVALLPTW